MDVTFQDKNEKPPFIKTQYAPLEIHISVIKLLKEKMDYLAARIAMVGDILDAHNDEFGNVKSPEEIAEKIEQLLKKSRFKKSN